jgi:hypothetical protein
MTRATLHDMAQELVKAGGLKRTQAGGLEEVLVIVVRDALEEAAKVASESDDDAPTLADRIRALKPELLSGGEEPSP